MAIHGMSKGGGISKPKAAQPAKTKAREGKLLKQARMSLGSGQQDIRALFMKQPRLSSKTINTSTFNTIKKTFIVKTIVKTKDSKSDIITKIDKNSQKNVFNMIKSDFPTTCNTRKLIPNLSEQGPKVKVGEKTADVRREQAPRTPVLQEYSKDKRLKRGAGQDNT